MNIKQKIIRISTFLLFSVMCLIAYARPNQESDTINYRGKRALKDSGSFNVVAVSCNRLDSSTVQVDIFFNQQIDPNSASEAVFYIDAIQEKPLGRAEFAKDGRRVRVKLSVSKKDFTFEVRGIKSYNGKTVENCNVSVKDSGEFRTGN